MCTRTTGPATPWATRLPSPTPFAARRAACPIPTRVCGSSSLTFDAATGRVVTQQYPTGFTVKYDYRPGTGFLNKVSNNATGAVYWTIDGLGDYPFDPGGKLVRQQFGNLLSSDKQKGRPPADVTQL